MFSFRLLAPTGHIDLKRKETKNIQRCLEYPFVFIIVTYIVTNGRFQGWPADGLDLVLEVDLVRELEQGDVVLLLHEVEFRMVDHTGRE